MNLCGLTMPYFAKTTHKGLQRKLDKSAATVHNQFPGAKVQKTNINMRSMYKAAHQICQNTLAVLLDTVIMTNDILIFNKKVLMFTLMFHKWPKDPQLAEVWRKQIAKSRSDAFNPTPGAQSTFVCSNHFPLGKRTPNNPATDFPSVFLTLSDYHHASTPKKRKRNKMQEKDEATSSKQISSDSDSEDHWKPGVDTDIAVKVPLHFEQFTREFEGNFTLV